MSRAPWNKLLADGSQVSEWWLSYSGQVTQHSPEYSAAEIYSHVWVAEQLYPAKYFEDVPLLGLLYEAYDHAHEIDLEDGGEKVPGLKETFMTIWYGTSGILPF